METKGGTKKNTLHHFLVATAPRRTGCCFVLHGRCRTSRCHPATGETFGRWRGGRWARRRWSSPGVWSPNLQSCVKITCNVHSAEVWNGFFVRSGVQKQATTRVSTSVVWWKKLSSFSILFKTAEVWWHPSPQFSSLRLSNCPLTDLDQICEISYTCTYLRVHRCSLHIVTLYRCTANLLVKCDCDYTLIFTMLRPMLWRVSLQSSLVPQNPNLQSRQMSRR